MVEREVPVADTRKELRALVLLGLKGMNLKEAVLLLSRAGFGPSEIAEMLGTTRNSVSVRLAEQRREKRSD